MAIPCSPLPTSVPGAPVSVSSVNPRYFYYNSTTLPLLGESHEYICHIQQPAERDAKYCTLSNHNSVFSTAVANRNNVIRMVAILNHSPSLSTTYASYFPNENPFKAGASGRWDIAQAAITPPQSSQFNSAYFDNLEAVVCDAYNAGIVVELTLLNPWDGRWATSPFNPSNTDEPASQGFTARAYFARFQIGPTDSLGPNALTRAAQRNLVTWTARRLKKYPNIVWEIANEPDLVPSPGPPPDPEALGATVSPSDVFAWQQSMATTLHSEDPAHLIMLNGHQAGVFAWDDTSRFQAASAHYTSLAPPRQGAIQIVRDPASAAARQLMPMAFNENRFVPDTSNPPRTADDVRAEAWEFMMSGGGLFDGYSIDRGDAVAMTVSAQLGILSLFLNPAAIHPASDPQSAFSSAAARPVSCNGEGDWCGHVKPYGSADNDQCSAPAAGANIYWSSLASFAGHEYALYLHHALPRAGFGGYWARPCGDGSTSGYRHVLDDRIQVRVPSPPTGCWTEGWFAPDTGVWIAGGSRTLLANTWYPTQFAPRYKDDVVLHLGLWKTGACP